MNANVRNQLLTAISNASGDKMLREQFEEELAFQKTAHPGMTPEQCEDYISEACASFAELNNNADEDE